MAASVVGLERRLRVGEIFSGYARASKHFQTSSKKLQVDFSAENANLTAIRV